MNPVFDLAAVGALVVITAVLGFAGIRTSRTRSDFFVASRSVGSVWNASAISGEYLSAGTFLGLAGLVLLSGAEGFWFPIGYAAGYLLVLLFVAAPLRRSGAYTIPDFVEARLESRAVRRVTSIVVLVIGWLYIVPQLHGASLALGVVADVPPWVGGGWWSRSSSRGSWPREACAPSRRCRPSSTGSSSRRSSCRRCSCWSPSPATGPRSIRRGSSRSRADPAPSTRMRRGRCCSPCCSARSVYRTCWCASTRVRDGASARRTTVAVIVLIGAFYAVSSTMGLIARVVAPDLAAPGVADTVVLALPSRLFPGLTGQVADGAARRRSVRCVPGDVVGDHRVARGGGEPGRVRRRRAIVPAVGGAVHGRAAGHRAADATRGPGVERGARVRLRGHRRCRRCCCWACGGRG